MWNSNDCAFCAKNNSTSTLFKLLAWESRHGELKGIFQLRAAFCVIQACLFERNSASLSAFILSPPFIPILLIPRLYCRHTVLISRGPDKGTCPRRPERSKFLSHQMHSLCFRFFFSLSFFSHYLSKSSPINNNSAASQVPLTSLIKEAECEREGTASPGGFGCRRWNASTHLATSVKSKVWRV